MIFHLYLDFFIDHLYLYFQSRSQRNIEQQCTRCQVTDAMCHVPCARCHVPGTRCNDNIYFFQFGYMRELQSTPQTLTDGYNQGSIGSRQTIFNHLVFFTIFNKKCGKKSSYLRKVYHKTIHLSPGGKRLVWAQVQERQ